MLLPNADKAIISENKISGYLLSATHPAGKSKAGFFIKIGYSLNDYFLVQERLKNIPLINQVSYFEESIYGVKYTVDGEFPGKDNKTYNIRTIWIVEKNEIYPKFVTAFPKR